MQELQTAGFSSFNIIGEVTEAVQRRLLDNYDINDRPPRMEEDLKFVPKDREEVIYLYMYRVAQNPSLQRQKRFQLAPVEVPGPDGPELFYHRPPILVDLFYLVMAHSKFRSDAERLMGWVMLTLHATPRLVYRPRRFLLPNGSEVDSTGGVWDPKRAVGDDEDVQMEKVSLSLVDDLTIGDAVNLFTLVEAPYRHWVTYRARVVLDGPLIPAGTGSSIAMGPAGDQDYLEPQSVPDTSTTLARPSGRITGARKGQPPIKPPGPAAHGVVPRHVLSQERARKKNNEE